jgi:hypothetical protein
LQEHAAQIFATPANGAGEDAEEEEGGVVDWVLQQAQDAAIAAIPMEIEAAEEAVSTETVEEITPAAAATPAVSQVSTAARKSSRVSKRTQFTSM